jgi:steroid 5-alpha reductase family enzyme
MIALMLGLAVFLSVAMAAGWVVQWRAGNAGWVDVVWSFALGAAGVIGALYPLQAGPLTMRQWLVAGVAAAWSLRLGTHIAERTARGPEDSRYAQFRRDWGAKFQPRMFGFLQIQAAAAALLAACILLAARNPDPLSFTDCEALAVVAAAIIGEAVADRQLRRFRADPKNRGRICDVGLWGWSRHPNYFFEWLGWLAYPLFAIDPFGSYARGGFALIAPAFMYWLLVHVSGIPPLEQQMLRSRGEAFRDYQHRVNAFVPMPPARK